jgi:protein-S-isoprenylcysteine O-methyltransferase Ste14
LTGIFMVWFGLCLVCFVVRTVFNWMKSKGSPAAEKGWVVGSVYAVMAVLWFSWFSMCLRDPVRIELSAWIRFPGLLLFIAGVSLFILSHTRLKGFRRKDGLITGGIYSKIRNPMYLGFIIWIIGLPLFTRSIVTLSSSPIWISAILLWKMLEEKELEKKYDDYSEYKRKTWF